MLLDQTTASLPIATYADLKRNKFGLQTLKSMNEVKALSID